MQMVHTLQTLKYLVADSLLGFFMFNTPDMLFIRNSINFNIVPTSLTSYYNYMHAYVVMFQVRSDQVNRFNVYNQSKLLSYTPVVGTSFGIFIKYY